MATPPPNVQAALASLRKRWGRAAPRWGEEVDGALAVAPRHSPAEDAEALPGIPDSLPATSDRAIPTGLIALDAILGLGGLPRSATTTLHGESPYSSLNSGQNASSRTLVSRPNSSSQTRSWPRPTAQWLRWPPTDTD
jgi:hypothetical protein